MRTIHALCHAASIPALWKQLPVPEEFQGRLRSELDVAQASRYPKLIHQFFRAISPPNNETGKCAFKTKEIFHYLFLHTENLHTDSC